MTNPQQTEGLTAEQIADGWVATNRSARPPFAKTVPIQMPFQLATMYNGELCVTSIISDKKPEEIFWPDYVAYRTFSPDRPNPPAQEPVAWRMVSPMGNVSYTDSKIAADHKWHVQWNNGGYIEPLYTSPPDQSSLIKVLTEALETAEVCAEDHKPRFRQDQDEEVFGTSSPP